MHMFDFDSSWNTHGMRLCDMSIEMLIALSEDGNNWRQQNQMNIPFHCSEPAISQHALQSVNIVS